jgi:hypothetical protein
MAIRTISAVALVSILIMLSKPLKVECNQNLTFMFMTSFGRFGLNSSGVIPAADIALEAINADPSILPGYDLVYDRVRDSEVSQSCTCSIVYIASLLLNQEHGHESSYNSYIYLSCIICNLNSGINFIEYLEIWLQNFVTIGYSYSVRIVCTDLAPICTITLQDCLLLNLIHFSHT